MKHRLKLIPRLFGIIVLLLLVNCSKDEFEEPVRNSRGKNDISIEQFKRETGINNFSDTFHIPENQNFSTSKNPDGSYELSDFVIDTDIIKKYVVDQKTTYTFKITPVEEVEGKIYNLIYYYKSGWQTLILELKPTQKNLSDLKEGITEKFDGTVAKIYQSELPDPVEQWCVTVTMTNTHCTGTGSCASGTCDQCSLCVSSGSVTICGSESLSFSYGDGTGSSGTGGGPSGGTGNGGGPDNPNPGDTQVSIIPNLENLEIDLDGDPVTVEDAANIKRLKKLTKNIAFKAKINEYKSKLATQYVEEGIMYGSVYEPIDGESTKNSTEWQNYPESHYLTIHMHQNKYYLSSTILKDTNPVMSDVDVLAMLGHYNYTENINATSILVSRQGTFALRVNNGYYVNDAYTIINPDNNWSTTTPEQNRFVEKYNDLVQDLFEAGNEAGALAGFINLINTYQINGHTLGLSLFQAVFDANGNITNWVKL